MEQKLENIKMIKFIINYAKPRNPPENLVSNQYGRQSQLQLLSFHLKDEIYPLSFQIVIHIIFLFQSNNNADSIDSKLDLLIIFLHRLFVLNLKRQHQNHNVLIYPYLFKYLLNSLLDSVLKGFSLNFTFEEVDSYHIYTVIIASSLHIIYMRPQNCRPSKESQPGHYRQSLSILSSELVRSSFSGESGRPNPYRDSLTFQGKTRNTMNLDLIDHIRRQLQYEQKQKERTSIFNLKTTLSELQKKISKAKKQLNTYKNIISEEDSEDECQKKNIIDLKSPILEQMSTLVSSQSKLNYLKSQSDLSSYPKIKTYYLNRLSEALEGKNQRALEHMIVSHKVLRNYYRIQSPTFADIEGKKVNLPRAKADLNKKTLILDIDQTIIHCQQDSTKPYDIVLPIQVQSGSIAQAYITIRPYAISFLKRMSKYYEIIAFTASHESYADVVLDELDPERQYIKHRLYRKNCVEIHENIYAKDLRIINRDLFSMVLVDNAPYSYLFQLENGIPILPYYNGQDNELVLLQKYLQQLSKIQDVREHNKKTFQLHKYCNFSELEQLVLNLYLKGSH